MDKRFEDLKIALDTYRGLVKGAGRNLVAAELETHLMKAPTTIEGIAWSQYTPYFNDGDPCVFGVNAYDPEVRIGNQWQEVPYNNEADPEFCWKNPAWRHWLKGFEDLMHDEAFQDVLLEAFGDHVKVHFIRPVHFRVDDYDHD